MRYLILLFLVSCSRKDVAPELTKYTVTFKVGSEIPGTLYELQVSKTGMSFQTLDTLYYNVLRGGVYNLTDVPLSLNDLVRIKATNKNDTAYSKLIKAY